MARAPKVSVIIPSYNGSAFIRESIESVLNQTFRDFELIICDDCSQDKTADIARSFQDSKIIFKKNKKNLGLFGNFNKSISHSRGKYICILGQDDLMLPENLEKKVRALESNDKAGFVYSYFYSIDGSGKNKGIRYGPYTEMPQETISKEKLIRQFYINLSSICFSTAVIKRECFEKAGNFDEDLKFAGDLDIILRILVNYDVECLEAPLVKFRVHEGSVTETIPKYELFEETHLVLTRNFRQIQEVAPQIKSLMPVTMGNLSIMAFSAAYNYYRLKKYNKANKNLIFSLKANPTILISELLKKLKKL